MNRLIVAIASRGLLSGDIDYHVIRTSMVIMFFFFGYQKWWEYEAQGLLPYINNGPLIFWLYPVFGVRGASWFLGVAEWAFCALLFLEPIRKVLIHDEWFAARRLSMMRIMARRTKAATVVA
jgi:hypothetical protein